MGNIGQGIPALKGGSIDALTTNPPDDMVALKLGFKVILDITAMKIPFACHSAHLGSRIPWTRKQTGAEKIHARLRRGDALLSDQSGRRPRDGGKIHQSRGPGVLNYAIDTDGKAVQKTLEVDPKGIELVLELIGKSMPQAASAKPEDFYDARFTNELKDSGFLKRLWGENFN